MGTLVDLLILFAIVAIIAIAAWFILSQITMPEPIKKIIIIVAVVAVAVVACLILLQLGGKGTGRLLWLPGEPNRAIAAVPAIPTLDM